MKKTIIANFKMNPETYDQAFDFCQTYFSLAEKKDLELALAMPFVYLRKLSDFSNFNLAAQNVFSENSGAHTGEISPLMLKDCNVKYVLIGHSERRKMGETDEMIVHKVAICLENGLIPVVCVGETKEQREKNQTLEIVKKQLMEVLNFLGKKEKNKDCDFLLAYEPIWAIGSENSDDPDSVDFVLNDLVNLASDFGWNIIGLYGGSVNEKNAAGFFKKQAISGALVGGASLKKEEFAAILEAASSTNGK